MKKLLQCLLIIGLVLGISGCTKSKTRGENELKVSATSNPHAKILEQAKPILKEKYGIDLTVEVLDDYYLFNKSLDANEVDANYFQHVPFFEEDVEKNGYELTNAGGIHIEPFGFYSKTIKDISELKDGATIVISNSVADHGRILTMLANANLITLKDGVKPINAELKDILDNPKNLQFKEVKPEFLVTSYNNNEGDLVAINGNYALQANLNPVNDAVILEDTSLDNPYVNIVAVKTGHENDEKIKALIEVLKSDEIKQFIEQEYKGSVIVVE